MDASKFDKKAVRVNRGGSWLNTAGNARAAYRIGFYPGDRYSLLGLRLCRDLVCESVRAATGVKQ